MKKFFGTSLNTNSEFKYLFFISLKNFTDLERLRVIKHSKSMSTYKINLKEQTATSINGITFKLTETKPGEYEGLCLNPKDIPPDDLDDVILGRMIKEAGVFYKMESERQKG